MRIALSVTEFPAVSQTFVLDHAVGLIARGHEVELHALWPGSMQALHADVERLGLMARVRYAPPRLAGTGALRRLLALLRHCGLGLLTEPRLALHLLRARGASRYEQISGAFSFFPSRNRYDLIHAHSGQNGVRLLPLYAAGHLSAPLLVTFHGHDVHALLLSRPPDFYEALFARASALVVCSALMRQRLLALGAPEQKLHLIPNGIDVRQIAFRIRSMPPTSRVQLLTIGRLVPFKGVQHLLSALALPALRALDLHLHIVGDGPLKAVLQAQAEAAGLAQRVTFHGACPREQVLPLIEASDLYLAPAIVDAEGNTETQGVALLEAMASGLPVIASAVGGIPETLGTASAALVPPGDVEALAAAVQDLLLRPESWAALGHAGRERVERHYDRQVWIDRLEALYVQSTRN